jgi:hypothetical protein
MSTAKESKRGPSPSPRNVSTARDVGEPRLGTRQRTVYVGSLKELSDDERFVVRALETVMRSPQAGTPRQRMLKLTLYSEREALKILRLRDELARFVPDSLN